jgi:hypothetical protein
MKPTVEKENDSGKIKNKNNKNPRIPFPREKEM